MNRRELLKATAALPLLIHKVPKSTNPSCAGTSFGSRLHGGIEALIRVDAGA